jgi:hypothetical protein
MLFRKSIKKIPNQSFFASFFLKKEAGAGRRPATFSFRQFARLSRRAEIVWASAG